VYATGVLSNKSEVKASFKVGGVIAKITVDEGASVKKGQLLAQLNMTEIEANVRAVRSGQVKAIRDLKRAQKLLEGEAATKEQVDDARTAASVAGAQASAAEFNRDHATIRAFEDGKVLRRLAETGEVVAAGQPVLVISAETSGWIVRVGLADRDVLRIKHGDPASLECAALPGVKIDAIVDEIAAAATPPLGTFEVELRLNAPEGLHLLSGLIASTRIDPSTTADTTQVALIPASALRDGNGKTAGVWVPNGKGGVERRKVMIAFFDGDHVAVAAGLDGVDAVITEGAAYLGPSSQIQIAAEPTKAAAH
jgi:RND family efflux transporter MFP subunit